METKGMVDQEYAGSITSWHGLYCQELVYYVLRETEGVSHYLPSHAANHCKAMTVVTHLYKPMTLLPFMTSTQCHNIITFIIFVILPRTEGMQTNTNTTNNLLLTIRDQILQGFSLLSFPVITCTYWR